MSNNNFFSRLVPPNRGRSFYHDLRARDRSVDPEEQATLALDEDNLNHDFHHYDVEQAGDMRGSRETVESHSHNPLLRGPASSPGTKRTGPRPGEWPTQDDDGDNDVPASLLVETRRDGEGSSKTPPKHGKMAKSKAPVPGPSTRRNRAQWEATQRQQRLHPEINPGASSRPPAPRAIMAQTGPITARDRAMWRWANVSNLDHFMNDVYDYYQSCGIWCILVGRVLHLINVAFVAIFLTFLTQCINYSKIPSSKSLAQVLEPQCTKKMSGWWDFGIWIFTFYFIWKSIQWLLDMRRLFHIRDFYVHLLKIPEHDMQTVSWQDVVVRIMMLRDENPKTAHNLTQGQRAWLGNQSKERLDAHDIANRLMRRENYLIALINKDILDFTVPIPFAGQRQLLSRTLEWTLKFSVLDFVFNERGQVHQEFLKGRSRGQLSQKLKARFMFAGVMNLILAPFLACYLIVVYFLTYYNEYQKNPSALGARAYTPLAEWKFREFNELPHLFQERLNMSYPFATRYVDQFPKVKTEQFARTVAFIAGSIVTVLAIGSLVDPEMFLGFEITHDRTVLFYLGIFGSVWAVARGTITEDNSVFDPEYALRNVIEYTHYQPDHWQGRLHSYDVKLEFAELYKIKVIIFLEEILSILVTPLILLTSLPKSSDQIIDFFREFTIHVDGLGYVCSFAVFDFKKGMGANKEPDTKPVAADVREDYYATKHGKMAASYYGFLDNYVINPKTGIPGHLPPGAKNHFHPPPSFPGLQSPTLAPAMQSSKMAANSDRGRGRSKGRSLAARGGPSSGAAGPPSMSPMASILLDPHHQPASFGNKSTYRPWTQRGVNQDDIIEESFEGEERSRPPHGRRGEDEDPAFEGRGGVLDESAWQTSPGKGLSREGSGAGDPEEPEVGVLGLMYQFQNNINHRVGGGVR